MLLPLAHCDFPEKLPLEVWLHLHTLSHKAMAMLYEYGAQGVNMGINIKKAAGAGIPSIYICTLCHDILAIQIL